jgi:hypothetical protein
VTAYASVAGAQNYVRLCWVCAHVGKICRKTRWVRCIWEFRSSAGCYTVYTGVVASEVYSANYTLRNSLCAGARLNRFIARHYEGLASHGARNSLCTRRTKCLCQSSLLRRALARVLRLAQR